MDLVKDCSFIQTLVDKPEEAVSPLYDPLIAVAWPLIPVKHISSELGHPSIGVAKDEAFSQHLLFKCPFAKEAVERFEPVADSIISLGIFIIDP